MRIFRCPKFGLRYTYQAFSVLNRAARDFGATVILHGHSLVETNAEAQRIAKENNFTFIHPYDDPLVIAGHLDGDGIPGTYREVLYLINISPDPRSLVLPEEAGKPYMLHPVQAASGAADLRATQARYSAGDGGFTVPGRTAVVFVVETGEDVR